MAWKASTQKHCPYIVEPKLIPILQFIGKAKFRPDLSPNKWLYVTNCCSSSPANSSAALQQVIHN